MRNEAKLFGLIAGAVCLLILLLAGWTHEAPAQAPVRSVTVTAGPCTGQATFTATATWIRSDAIPGDTAHVAWGPRNPVDDKYIGPANTYKTTDNKHATTLVCPPAGDTAYYKVCVKVLRPNRAASRDRCEMLDISGPTVADPLPVDSLRVLYGAAVEEAIGMEPLANPLQRVAIAGACSRVEVDTATLWTRVICDSGQVSFSWCRPVRLADSAVTWARRRESCTRLYDTAMVRRYGLRWQPDRIAHPAFRIQPLPDDSLSLEWEML